MTRANTHICTVIKENVQSLLAGRNNCLQMRFKRNGDWAHLTSIGIEFQTEEEAKENKRSPSATLLRAGLLRKSMFCELERLLRMCDGFFSSTSVTYDGTVLL